MRRSQRLEQARMKGSLTAARELRRLNLDMSRAVDVFRIILDANLWLLFQPLDNLLGAYSHVGSGGVLITTKRPRSVQRLTAAHEYGHHVLNHNSTIDDEGNLRNPTTMNTVEEAAAQAFATDFLMPPQLINHLRNELNVPDDMRPYHAYLLSLFMGTSYEATVYQLVAQNLLSADKIEEFTPRTILQKIKREIGRGVGPDNSWAEVWAVDETFSGRSLTISVDDEISVCLDENPSTGYIWVINSEGLLELRSNEQQIDGDVATPAYNHTEETNNNIPSVALLRSAYEPVPFSLDTEEVGGHGHRFMNLRALRKTENWNLSLSLSRPWRKKAEPAKRFMLTLHIQNRPTGEASQGYLDDVKEVDMALPSQGV